jgi:hypothetical protein
VARTRSKAKSRGDGGAGFGGLPKVVWKHPDYCGLSGSAAKLLMDLACQYNGRNNGNLTVAHSILKPRGWPSKTTITRATQELLATQLIICTREGRFTNPGGRCALYALTWKPIDECLGKGLTISPTATPPRKFSLEANKTPRPEHGPGSVQNVNRQRPRDDEGKYTSVQIQDRSRAVT